MNTKRLAPLWAFALLLLFAQGTRAQPTCFFTHRLSHDCPDTSGALVFLGRVVSLTERDTQTGAETETDRLNGYLRGTTVVAVEELFKGEAGASVELRLDRGCYGRLEKGKTYLFNLGRTPETHDPFHWSEEWDYLSEEEAAKLREAIRANVGGERQPRLYGIVRHAERHSPVVGLTVVAERDGARFETHTDDAGRYEFGELPDGEYKVYPLLPPSLRPPDDPRDGRPRERHDDTAHVLNAALCGARQDFGVLDTGSISGRVVDADGQPFVSAGVSLSRFDGRSSLPSLAYAKETLMHKREGNFAFVNLPPGRYLIEVIMPGDGRSWPVLYYPGVVYQKDASVIDLKPGEKLADLVVKLPRQKKK